MTALTLEQIAARIATAQSGYAAATPQYERNVFAQIRDEYDVTPLSAPRS
jgi:hypothetical protein